MPKENCSEGYRNEPVRYFTGKPCKNGHLSERSISNGGCLECHRLRNARHRSKKKGGQEIVNEKVSSHVAVVDEHLPKGVIPGARVFIMGRQVR